MSSSQFRPWDTEPLSCFKMHHTASNHEAEAEDLRSTASTASRKNCKEGHSDHQANSRLVSNIYYSCDFLRGRI